MICINCSEDNANALVWAFCSDACKRDYTGEDDGAIALVSKPVVKILTPLHEDLYVLNDVGKVIHLCNNCIVPSDTAGYAKNTEDCVHRSPE